MEVKLRIINNEKIPELKSLTGDENDKLTTYVKKDILTHQEVDKNFEALINYIKTLVDFVEIQNSTLNIYINKLDTFIDNTNNSDNNSNTNNSFEYINEQLIKIQNDIKNINEKITILKGI